MAHYSADDVKKDLMAFGLPEPTAAEIGMFTGLDTIGGSGQAAIANYAHTKSEQIKAEATNPLKLFLDQEKTRRAGFEDQANGLYAKLQDTISAAPKLFGNLTPDQIQQYIAPINQAAKAGSANLEGDYARRGITGSNIEANALSDAQRKYQENILATGLNLGMNTQQAQASAIQNRINQLFGASGQSSNLLGAGMGQLSTEQQNNLQQITQLPLFLRAMNNQDVLFNKQMNDGPSFWDKFDRGINTTNNLINLGQSAASNVMKLSSGAGANAQALPYGQV